MFGLLLAFALASDPETTGAEAPPPEPELIPGVQNAGLPPGATNQLKPLQATPIGPAPPPLPVLQGTAPMVPPLPTHQGLPAPPPPIQQAGLPPMAEPLPVIEAELPPDAKIWVIDPDADPPEEDEGR